MRNSIPPLFFLNNDFRERCLSDKVRLESLTKGRGHWSGLIYYSLKLLNTLTRMFRCASLSRKNSNSCYRLLCYSPFNNPRYFKFNLWPRFSLFFPSFIFGVLQLFSPLSSQVRKNSKNKPLPFLTLSQQWVGHGPFEKGKWPRSWRRWYWPSSCFTQYIPNNNPSTPPIFCYPFFFFFGFYPIQ